MATKEEEKSTAVTKYAAKLPIGQMIADKGVSLEGVTVDDLDRISELFMSLSSTPDNFDDDGDEGGWAMPRVRIVQPASDPEGLDYSQGDIYEPNAILGSLKQDVPWRVIPAFYYMQYTYFPHIDSGERIESVYRKTAKKFLKPSDTEWQGNTPPKYHDDHVFVVLDADTLKPYALNFTKSSAKVGKAMAGALRGQTTVSDFAWDISTKKNEKETRRWFSYEAKRDREDDPAPAARVAAQIIGNAYKEFYKAQVASQIEYHESIQNAVSNLTSGGDAVPLPAFGTSDEDGSFEDEM